jgi:hypothetical protein
VRKRSKSQRAREINIGRIDRGPLAALVAIAAATVLLKVALGPKGNGGRHRCQPPLRRAKDLPVFVTWLIEPEGLPTRSRSWLTSSGVASYRFRRSPEDFFFFDVPRPFLG